MNIIDAFQHSDLNGQNLQQIFNEINRIFDTWSNDDPTKFSMKSRISANRWKLSSCDMCINKKSRKKRYLIMKPAYKVSKILSIIQSGAKGQLISNGLFDVLVCTKKPTKIFKDRG